MKNKHAFWKKVKTKEGRGVSIGIESKDGTVLMEKNEVKDSWREYFSELLGGEETVSSMVEEDQEGAMEGVSNGMLEEKITEEEIRKSVGKLKKGKAGGVCEISGELLKAGGEVVIKWMTVMYSLVWGTGVAPMDWQRAIIVPVHKKNSRRKCGNYRGISLLSIPGKVFAKILNDCVRCLIENRLLEEQAGFRSGRG